MSKLRKIQNAEDIFTVTIQSGTDLTNYAESYQTEDPESDDLTKILVYAYKNNWSINNCYTEIELMKQLENHLTEDELLELSNVEKLKEDIDYLTNQIDTCAHHGIENITITKFGEKYELDVTKEDIHDIFLNMIS